MLHLRIIGVIWLISGLLPALKHPVNVWSLATHPEYRIGIGPLGAGYWITQVCVEISFLLIMLIGLGLIFLRRRAVVAAGFLGVIGLLSCVWFILTQGMKHGPEPYVVMWCGVIFSVYTIFCAWKFRHHGRLA